MQSKVLVIIPAYNEEENIKNTVEKLVSAGWGGYDYLIINDGSTDATQKICKSNFYNVCSLPINSGIGAAVQTGYKYAASHGYDIAVQFDADGQHDVTYIEKLVFTLESEESDIVIGSRFVNPDEENFTSTKARRFGIQFLSGLIYFCTKTRVYDVTSGFRAVNRRFIELYAKDYPMDYPEPEAIVQAVKRNARITEVYARMHERQSGKSSINFMKSIYYMIKVSLAILLRTFER